MRRITWWVIVGALCVTYAVGRAQEWQWQHGWNLPTLAALDWCQALDTNTVWAVGDSGIILQTTNGGTAWTRHDAGTQRRLWHVEFADVRHGWVCGDSGIVLRTTDGGSTWLMQDALVGGALRGLSFIDTSNGWVVGADGDSAILHTTDGGQTWDCQERYYRDLYGINFHDALNGIAVGPVGYTFFTTNGGQNWQASTNAGYSLYDVRFVAPDIAYSVGWSIKKTIDGGRTWTYVVGLRYESYSLSFIGAGGWTCGTNGYVAHTADSGAHWSAQSSGVFVKLSGISFADSLHGWTVGDNGAILKTRNGGTSWTDMNGDPLTDYEFHSIACNSVGEQIWAAGDHGTLLRSVDGGVHWRYIETGWDLSFRRIVYTPNAVWIVSNDGVILYSTDHGDNWVWMQPAFVALENLTFADARHVWAVGWSGTVMASTDGGNVWQVQSTGNEQAFLLGVSFADTLHGCAVGGYGATLFTTDGGQHWQHADTLTDQTLNDVKLLPDGRGWIVGERDKVYRTTNFGATWAAVPGLPDHNWRVLRAIGSDTLWIISDDGTYVRSEDGGVSWNAGTIGQTWGINDVAFTPDGRQAWATGVYERILHYDARVGTVPRESGSLPNNFRLTAYPNPFNAMVRLEFDVPRSGKFRLNIYDVNGRLVRTLVDHTLAAGTHTITLNAEVLPSGLYFAHLSGGGAALTQKLVLLR